MNYVRKNEHSDIGIRFQNIGKGITETRYFDSQFFNSPNADNLVDAILQSSQKLKLDKYLQLSMGVPSVNWSCGLHIVHGALESSIQKVNWGVAK